jgi:hypothetical protein
MTVDALMKLPMPEVQNYMLEVAPLLRLGREYKSGFLEALQEAPGTFYSLRFILHLIFNIVPSGMLGRLQ